MILFLAVVLYSLFFVTPVAAGKIECSEATLRNTEFRGSDFKASKILPLCVYFEGINAEAEKDCGCRDINVFVSLLTKFANWLFGIVGAVALAAFIYGGFVILTAAGSSEKVKKGKDVLVAAVVGLVIVFTAQVGLKFLLKTFLTPADKEPVEEIGKLKDGLNIKVEKFEP